MEDMISTYIILIGKSEGKRRLGRTRCRREDNIRILLRELGCRRVDWIHLAQDREQWRALVIMVMNLRAT
jgi:hypothetical protein